MKFDLTTISHYSNILKLRPLEHLKLLKMAREQKSLATPGIEHWADNIFVSKY
jgi:hypothetical protein